MLYKTSIALYFSVACLISWSAKFYMASIDNDLAQGIISKGLIQLVAQFGPTLAGFIMIFREQGNRGIVNVFKNISRLKITVKWIVFTLFFELVIFHLVLLFCITTGYGKLQVQTNHIFSSYLDFFINLLILSLLTGLGEEIGWRGYLLPKLQSRYKIIVTVLILSVLNSLWHLRSDCIVMILQNDLAGFSRVYFPDMGLRMLITIPVICVIIFLFNTTKGSLLIMILFHGAANASYEWVKDITGNPDPEFLLPIFAAVLWISTIIFIPAIFSQARNRKLVIQI